MKSKILFLCFGFILLSLSIWAQKLSNLRTQSIRFSCDTIYFDSLLVLPNTFVLLDENNNQISQNLYQLFASKSAILLDSSLNLNANLIAKYRVFNFDFYQVKSKRSKTEPKSFDFMMDPFMPPSQNQSDADYSFSELAKTGNISRGISVGNGKDLSVSSNLNLQLSGKISPDLLLNASISDNNLPIQPDGTTQMIQDFDKIFLQLVHPKASINLGDFELKSKNSYFLKYTKKAQGVSTELRLLTNEKQNTKLIASAGIALSKGKYTRNKIVAIEGNQGPYRFWGANNETYIIVIAGSEKVFIDGKQLVRGQSNDYIIDYNSAELTFTPSVIISKDKRIEVEFEYTDRNYARVLSTADINFNSKSVDFGVHYFVESDLKNQSLDQSLSSEQKKMLSAVGDSLLNAIAPQIDSVAFTNDRILYKMVDSLGYDSVFVFSTSADSAHFALTFSNVGNGNGNYILSKNAANGRVFQWVTPISNVPQGNYEPVILLVSPKKMQMLAFNTSLHLKYGFEISTELALSTRDLNTFSELDANDDKGFAIKLNTSKSQLVKVLKSDWRTSVFANYEFVQANFAFVERFRPLEFERNWALFQDKKQRDEHLMSFGARATSNGIGFFEYSFSALIKPAQVKGFKSLFSTELNRTKWKAFARFDVSSVEQNSLITDIRKYNAAFVWKTKKVYTGVEANYELYDYKQISAMAFYETSVFLNSPDSSKTFFNVRYNYRIDLVGLNTTLRPQTSSDEFVSELRFTQSKTNKLHFRFALRNLTINDTNGTVKYPEQTIVGRIEHQLNLFKNAITAQSFLQSGTSLDDRKEFTYIEVARGQGVYTWNDYNANGAKELDEFELAAFADQASYIRIFLPSNEKIKTFANSFSTSIWLQPIKALSKTENKMLKFLNKFSNQLSLRFDSKNTFPNMAQAVNPFYANWKADEIISINTYFLNVLYFNRNQSVFGGEIGYRNSLSKALLLNGFEGSELVETFAKFRFLLRKAFLFNVYVSNGIKSNVTEYFVQRNYVISHYQIKPEFQIQPGKEWRILLWYDYKNKINTLKVVDSQQSMQHSLGLELKYNTLHKGSIGSRIQYVSMLYNSNQSDALAYEMLNGLQIGDNVLWNINYQRTIAKNLQLSIQYDGRKSSKINASHIGSVQLRAYF